MISCIVTTYRRPINILKRAVDSIINQTYRDIELIVVNDAPNDIDLVEEIRELLNDYPVQKQYIVHEQNKGACAARNTGIEHAKGEYLAFLDDDDEWLPEKLERQMSYMNDLNVALVYCSHYIIDKTGKSRLIIEPLAREGIHDDEFERLLCCNFVGSTSYPLLRTEAVKDVGGFTVGLKSSQDHDLWIRIAQKYRIVYCNEPLVKLYYSDESISRSSNNRLQGYNYLLDKYSGFYAEHKEILNYRLNYLAICCIRIGKVKKFFEYWFKAICIKPISKSNLLLLEKVIAKISTRQ